MIYCSCSCFFDEYSYQKDDVLTDHCTLDQSVHWIVQYVQKALQIFLHLFLIAETNVDSAHSLSCDQGMKKC